MLKKKKQKKIEKKGKENKQTNKQDLFRGQGGESLGTVKSHKINL